MDTQEEKTATTTFKTPEMHYNDVIGMGQSLSPADVHISSARGLVLAEDVFARTPLPPFTMSAVDGFAVRARDVVPGSPLPVTGDLPLSGEIPSLYPGTSIRIRAGAPIPLGIDAILAVRDTKNRRENMRTEPPQSIIPTATLNPGDNIRLEGSDIEVGTQAFIAGTQLTASHIAALISLGHSTVRTHRRPIVGVVSMPNDLSLPTDTTNYAPDPNTALVAELVTERGGEPRVIIIRGNTPKEIDQQIYDAAAQVDFLISTGGKAGGTSPIMKRAIAQGVTYEKVAMQPGKTQGWGLITIASPSTSEVFGFTTLDAHAVPTVCLPNNPISAFVSMHLFALPLLDALMGRPTHAFQELFRKEIAGASWLHKVGREQYMPIMRDSMGRVVPAHKGDVRSHLLATLPYTAGFARVPVDVDEVREGEQIDVFWCQ